MAICKYFIGFLPINFLNLLYSVAQQTRRGTKKREAYRLPPRLLYYFFFLSLFKPLFNPDLTFFVALSTGLLDVDDDDELPPPFLASYSLKYSFCSASVPQTIFRPFALPFSKKSVPEQSVRHTRQICNSVFSILQWSLLPCRLRGQLQILGNQQRSRPDVPGTMLQRGRMRQQR